MTLSVVSRGLCSCDCLLKFSGVSSGHLSKHSQIRSQFNSRLSPIDSWSQGGERVTVWCHNCGAPPGIRPVILEANFYCETKYNYQERLLEFCSGKKLMAACRQYILCSAVTAPIHNNGGVRCVLCCESSPGCVH